jgi:hypothetical protein
MIGVEIVDGQQPADHLVQEEIDVLAERFSLA